MLAEQIRKDGIASGWNPIMQHEWAVSDNRIPMFLALIHSEICEAYSEIWGSDSPTAFLPAELADIQIRTLDLAGGLSTDFAYYVEHTTGGGIANAESDAQAFLILHQRVTDALEAFRHDNKHRFLVALGQLYRSTNNLAVLLNIDLNDAIDAKMAINRDRQRRNGGKRI